MVKALDCDNFVSEFELQSYYYVHFLTNTLEIRMNLLIFQAMGEMIALLIFYKDHFGIK